MTGATTDAGLPRWSAEDTGRIERHVSEAHQIRLATADGFGMKHLSRTVKRILVQLCPGGQCCLLAPDGEGTGVLESQNRRDAGRS